MPPALASIGFAPQRNQDEFYANFGQDDGSTVLRASFAPTRRAERRPAAPGQARGLAGEQAIEQAARRATGEVRRWRPSAAYYHSHVHTQK